MGPPTVMGISDPGCEFTMWPLSIIWGVAFDMGGILTGPLNDEKFGELALWVNGPDFGMNSSAPGLDPFKQKTKFIYWWAGIMLHA